MDESLFENFSDFFNSKEGTLSFKPDEIKKIRENLGLTQNQFSKLFQINIDKLKKWEIGNQNPEGAELTLLTLFRENKIGLEHLIPDNLDEFILKKTPTKVRSRYIKAKTHYLKSLKLIFVDPEMAFIRLVAAEEELAVGIFETFKLKFTDIKFYNKSHDMKMALAPVLALFVNILENLSFEGMPGGFKLEITEGSIKLVMLINGQSITSPNPANIWIENNSNSNFLDSIYNEFCSRIPNHDVKNFIKSRAKARDKIFYSEDG